MRAQSRQAETAAGEEATLALVNVGMNNKAADLQMDQSFQSLHWSMPRCQSRTLP